MSQTTPSGVDDESASLPPRTGHTPDVPAASAAPASVTAHEPVASAVEPVLASLSAGILLLILSMTGSTLLFTEPGRLSWI